MLNEKGLINMNSGEALVDIYPNSLFLKRLKEITKSGKIGALTSNCFKKLIDSTEKAKLVETSLDGFLPFVISCGDNIFTGIIEENLELVTYKHTKTDIIILKSFLPNPNAAISIMKQKEIAFADYAISAYCLAYFYETKYLLSLFLNNQDVVKELFSQPLLGVKDIFCCVDLFDNYVEVLKYNFKNKLKADKKKIKDCVKLRYLDENIKTILHRTNTYSHHVINLLTLL